MKDYYQILEIAPSASQDAIKEQYRFLVQAWHPDKFPNPAQKLKAEEKLKEINAAYEFLGNSAKRAEYDSRARYNTSSSHEQEHRERTAPRQPEDERRKKEEAARRAKEEQWQKERANRERAEAEKRRAEDVRKQRINQLDQEISLMNQEISKLNKDLPKMPTPIFGILFFIGGMFSLGGSSENTGLFLFLSVISFIIGGILFSTRNRFYRENYKPIIDEVEKQKQRLQQLIRERHYLK
jgi:curved DNA-binding protein CbpA